MAGTASIADLLNSRAGQGASYDYAFSGWDQLVSTYESGQLGPLIDSLNAPARNGLIAIYNAPVPGPSSGYHTVGASLASNLMAASRDQLASTSQNAALLPGIISQYPEAAVLVCTQPRGRKFWMEYISIAHLMTTGTPPVDPNLWPVTTITAAPNPVPSGQASTTISWTIMLPGGGTPSAAVWASVNGGAEVRVAGPSAGGSFALPVVEGGTIKVRIYYGSDRSQRLNEVTVTNPADGKLPPPGGAVGGGTPSLPITTDGGLDVGQWVQDHPLEAGLLVGVAGYVVLGPAGLLH